MPENNRPHSLTELKRLRKPARNVNNEFDPQDSPSFRGKKVELLI